MNDSQGHNKQKVLFIDDSVDAHRLLRARLKHEPIELIDATEGAEGLRLAKSERPSTILLELDIPGMDGFTVLRTLKSDPETSNIPVVILSSLSGSDDKVTAFDLGAADFVRKSLNEPADIAELKARLRASLRLERLIRMLAESAEIDSLTGLGNRKQFNRHWPQALAENKRYQHPLTLAFFDLDHFKKVNDTYGHPAGDEVLTEFARLIQRTCRAADVPCRLGGEEFGLIMSNTSPKDAAAVCERLRIALSELVWARHPEHKITVSIGVIGASGPANCTSEQWIELVDKSLYAAKHGGRNRVVVGEDLAPGPTLAQAG